VILEGHGVSAVSDEACRYRIEFTSSAVQGTGAVASADKAVTRGVFCGDAQVSSMPLDKQLSG